MVQRLSFTEPRSGRAYQLSLGDRVQTWEGEGEVMAFRPSTPGLSPRFTVRFGRQLATIGVDEVENLGDFAR